MLVKSVSPWEKHPVWLSWMAGVFVICVIALRRKIDIVLEAEVRGTTRVCVIPLQCVLKTDSPIDTRIVSWLVIVTALTIFS